jgi:hypothetical protein
MSSPVSQIVLTFDSIRTVACDAIRQTATTTVGTLRNGLGYSQVLDILIM